MQIKQLYTNCLAQGAYYISSNGEAAIIDPLRETKPYIELLNQNNDKLKYVFETHFHADFVSGHVDLAKETGAKIVFGPNAQTSYQSYIAKDNEEFKVGKLTIKVLHTPGHTLESSCYLLIDENNKPISIFTGDTLFIGDVGRPDLAVKSDLSQEDLAGMLYDSLRNKIITLPDDVIVYPAHGAGSACGKNMSSEKQDTLGNQKKLNYALQNISKQDFVKSLICGIMPPPQYFSKNANLNKNGYANVNEVISKGNKALSVNEFKKESTNALVLDVRKPNDFVQAHIPNSIFIGIDGQFAPWVGTVIEDINQKIIIVAPEGREEETVLRLSRVGYDNCVGYLKGGLEAWINAGELTDSIQSISAEDFSKLKVNDLNVVDVRKPGEFENGHLKTATNKPLDFISKWSLNFETPTPTYLHCAGGYRSVIAASILRKKGVKNLIDISGGYSAIQKTNLEVVK
ncbi:MAG: MBL fold metallo-hydrolase [Bacteroidetes bacterium]|nr:MBL fold metallo-hydrolase [Bacteroidota bacterium]